MTKRRIFKQNLFYCISKKAACTREGEKAEAILKIRFFYLTHFPSVKSMTQKVI